MSSENVELVRRAVDAWNRRDPEIWRRYATPDFEWLPTGPAAVERSVYRGHEEAAAGVAGALDPWERFELSDEREVRDLGDSVLWLGRLKMRGAASGLELDQEFAVLFAVRDGLFTRVQSFGSWAAAEAAPGSG